MRNEEKEMKLNGVLSKAEGLYGGIMHEVERILMAEPDTEKAIAGIRENFVIIASGFLEYENELAKLQALEGAF